MGISFTFACSYLRLAPDTSLFSNSVSTRMLPVSSIFSTYELIVRVYLIPIIYNACNLAMFFQVLLYQPTSASCSHLVDDPE